MTTLALTHRAAQSKTRSLRVPRIHWKFLYFLGILVLASLFVSYVFLVNELTKGAYVIKNYNKEISSLVAENKALENNFAESGFLGNAMDKVKELSFQKTSEVKYVQILDSSLAEVPKNYQK